MKIFLQQLCLSQLNSFIAETGDEESEYESDEDKRNDNRLNFRLKKVEELRKKIKCDICDFTTKSEIGLKSHRTKKHKE